MSYAVGRFLALAVLIGWPSLGLGQDTKPSRQDQERFQALLTAHNKARAAAKLPPLTLDSKLAAAARVQALDMAESGKMSHDGSDGSKFFERIERQGYRQKNAAENVAFGQRTTASVFKAWMQSPHHKENILGPYTQVGFACVRDEDGISYWCADFGTPWNKPDITNAPAECVAALNQAREAAGRKPLKLNPQLVEVATFGAKLLASSDKSTSPAKLGEEMTGKIKKSGYSFRALAQSAAAGQTLPTEVADAWLSSPKQKKIILGDFSEVGVAVAASEKGVPNWYLILASPAPAE